VLAYFSIDVWRPEGSIVALLEVKGLRTEFRTADGVVRAVNGISYSVDEGETLGIVGESGCGKSVSALSLMRLIPQPPGRIVSGEVFFEGQDLLKLSDDAMQHVRGRKIAMVFQDPMTSLNPVLTINRQISEALQLHLGMNDVQSRRRTTELLSLVGIPDPARRIDDYPHQFSGGMRQRVMIAMALSCNPRLLIADEPTTALDVTIQAQIVELVKRIQDELHIAIIWITHDLGVIARLVDKVAVMYAGRVIEEAPVDEIFDNPRHPYTRGLLASVPRLDEARRDTLRPIEGMPPDLTQGFNSCPFEPRCDYVVERCTREDPPLLVVNDNQHRSACWVWDKLATPEG
jgi:oligopeptide transport system ATP-binding protein